MEVAPEVPGVAVGWSRWVAAASLDAWRQRLAARARAMLVASGRLADYLRTAGL